MSMELNRFARSLIFDIKPYNSDSLKELNEDIIITFPDGIPAFEDTREFKLLTNAEIHPFLYLEAIGRKDLGFVCVSPFMIHPSYTIPLKASEQLKLGLQKPEDALSISLVTVNADPRENTANLLAPIIINLRSRIGNQVILENYPVRYNIWEGVESMTNTANKE